MFSLWYPFRLIQPFVFPSEAVMKKLNIFLCVPRWNFLRNAYIEIRWPSLKIYVASILFNTARLNISLLFCYSRLKWFLKKFWSFSFSFSIQDVFLLLNCRVGPLCSLTMKLLSVMHIEKQCIKPDCLGSNIGSSIH